MSTPSRFGRIAPLIAALDALSRTQREATARIARDLGCARVSVPLLRVLDERPRQLTEIASLLRVDVSVASRHAAHLVDAGLAERTVSAQDRRVRTIALTDPGRALLHRAQDHIGELTRQTFSGWTDDDIASAALVLDRLAETIGTAVTDPPSPAADIPPPTRPS